MSIPTSNTLAPLPADYGALLTQLKARIQSAQYAALRAVNKELVALYNDIGKLIEERQLAQGWGRNVVENLARDLRLEFGEKSGYSARNLWYMRIFYREYKDYPNLQPLAAEIAWTKNTLILDRCQDPQEREFYLRSTARYGWTRRVWFLLRLILACSLNGMVILWRIGWILFWGGLCLIGLLL